MGPIQELKYLTEECSCDTHCSQLEVNNNPLYKLVSFFFLFFNHYRAIVKYSESEKLAPNGSIFIPHRLFPVRSSPVSRESANDNWKTWWTTNNAMLESWKHGPLPLRACAGPFCRRVWDARANGHWRQEKRFTGVPVCGAVQGERGSGIL